MTRIDPTKMEAAREWADIVRDGLPVGPNSNRVRAAAEVIAALPEECIGADELRDIIQRTPTDPASLAHRALVKEIRDLLPAPKLPTLADMTPEERAACQWMQGRYGSSALLVITDVREACCDVVYRHGSTATVAHGWITPLPNLPKMQWPDEHHPATDTEETPEPAQPRPEDVPDGYWLIRWWDEEHPVPAEKVEGQWWVIGRATVLPAKDVTLVSRLVPEVKA